VGEGAAQLAAAVLDNLKIEIFNEIPIKEMRANSLTELDLNGKRVGVEGGMVVAGLIPVMGGLTKLSLAQNELGEKGTKAICEALEQNKTLKELDISGVGDPYGDNNIGGSAGAKHVAKMLGVNGSLTSVDVGWNDITGDVAQELATVVLSKPTLEDFCNIPIKKLRADSLSELDLSGKGVGVPGALVLANLLPATGGLTKLSLAKNKLGEECTKFLCDALDGNNTLKELDLSGEHTCQGIVSNIGWTAGAKHVANMLLVNGALTVANLLRNHLDEESALMLAEVAKQKGISLCGIQRDQTTANLKFLATFLSRRQGLEPPDAILLASDLSQAVVTGALTQVLAF
jgi:Ran GTPase-activating protein (RanGAP) involved in mRNA processing and transport